MHNGRLVLVERRSFPGWHLDDCFSKAQSSRMEFRLNANRTAPKPDVAAGGRDCVTISAVDPLQSFRFLLINAQRFEIEDDD